MKIGVWDIERVDADAVVENVRYNGVKTTSKGISTIPPGLAGTDNGHNWAYK